MLILICLINDSSHQGRNYSINTRETNAQKVVEKGTKRNKFDLVSISFFGIDSQQASTHSGTPVNRRCHRPGKGGERATKSAGNSRTHSTSSLSSNTFTHTTTTPIVQQQVLLQNDDFQHFWTTFAMNPRKFRSSAKS